MKVMEKLLEWLLDHTKGVGVVMFISAVVLGGVDICRFVCTIRHDL